MENKLSFQDTMYKNVHKKKNRLININRPENILRSNETRTKDKSLYFYLKMVNGKTKWKCIVFVFYSTVLIANYISHPVLSHPTQACFVHQHWVSVWSQFEEFFSDYGCQVFFYKPHSATSIILQGHILLNTQN